ncbi:MAG: porin family protein [Armatimonadetes bacterium]|nr:porin family protein [Armatimonadota bacterium]
MVRRSALLIVFYLALASISAMAWAQAEDAPTSTEEASETEAMAEVQTAASAGSSFVDETIPGRQSTIAIYGWMTGVNADLRAGPVEANVDASFSDILDNLDTGLMLYYEVLEEDTGFYLDVVHARVSDVIERPLLTVDWDVKQTLIEAGALLRQGAPGAGVDIILGVRYVDLDSEVGLTPPSVSAASGDHWLDPVVGVRYRTSLSDKWAFSGRGDIGGFGFGSDFSWQLVGVFGYEMSPRWSLGLGYRYLDIDYDESDFGFDGAMSGPLVGFAYGF